VHDEESRVLPKSKVDLYAAIRRIVEDLAARALKRKYGGDRNRVEVR